ncbi:MAG: Phytanoyl-CoA dioxygenase [Bacteroidetes bacterium]|jgi:ectoine hydroxylase-related dioxygenase (phytanoyl-CoA dioxygenase family)|nr:Phytanoyl-CoA dioxygenase [Bacteroidota bacterium]
MKDLTEYKKNGYLLLKDFIEKAEIDAIRTEAKEIFSIQLKRLGLISSLKVSDAEFEQALYKLFETDFQQLVYCGKQLQHMISLHRLSLSEKIVSKLKELGLEFPIINVRPVIFFNNARLGKRDVDWKKPPHQDFRTTQGSADSVVVWIPLVDIPKELGALEIIPGSHLQGLLEYEVSNDYHTLKSTNEEDFISVEVKKGDALFFSTLLVHRSGNNVTDKIRWSCHFRYNNIYDESFINRGFPHTYLYKPEDKLVTPDFPTPADMKKVF